MVVPDGFCGQHASDVWVLPSTWRSVFERAPVGPAPRRRTSCSRWRWGWPEGRLGCFYSSRVTWASGLISFHPGYSGAQTERTRHGAGSAGTRGPLMAGPGTVVGAYPFLQRLPASSWSTFDTAHLHRSILKFIPQNYLQEIPVIDFDSLHHKKFFKTRLNKVRLILLSHVIY